MIVCWGNYEDDEQRGVFFQASSVKVVPKEETTGDALLQWCANRMEGVGTKTAEKIVSALGVTSLAELEEEAAKDGFAERLTSVKGLVRSKARFIAEQMRESQGVRSILESFNVHEGAVKSAEHAGISRDDLAANPYASLLNVSAVPVVTLDAIAQHFDPSADFHHDRLAAITFRSLVQACSSDGHCFLHASTLHGRVNRRGDSRVAGDFAKALGTLHRRNAIYLLRESDLKPTHDGCYPFSDAKDEALCYPKALSIAETFCVDEVYKRMRKRQNDSPGREEWCERVDAWFENLAKRSAELESSLTERQKTAVKMATIDAMHIVHGGPGTGKSFTIAMIVRMLLNAVDDKDGMSHWRISVCAPTGRAAKRLETIFSSQGLYQLVGPKSSLQVQTIHKLLKLRGDSSSLQTFEGVTRDEAGEIKADMVIVDEASMLSLELGRRVSPILNLFDALSPETKLVLVGDKDQLPPVSPGSILTQLLSVPEVPQTKLRTDEVFRQERQSAILRLADAINGGDGSSMSNALDHFAAPAVDDGTERRNFRERITEAISPFSGGEGKGSQALFVEVGKDQVAESVIEEVIQGMRERKIIQDLYSGFQVLTPHRREEGGVWSLNAKLQGVLNPNDGSKRRAEVEVERGRSRKGEPLKQRFRKGDKVLQNRNNWDKGVCNGDLGVLSTVRKDHQKLASVDFWSILGDGKQSDPLDYSLSEMNELEVAWATTVHKAQGSQFKVVVFRAPSGRNNFLASRELLYTAVTRPESCLIIVGSLRNLKAALQTGDRVRNSCLARRLQGRLDRFE